MNGSVTARSRLATLDAVRGFAVMGILVMNIVDFAMPGYAYVDPHYYGGGTGANLWAWFVPFVLADAKMRGLFTMLFGASTVLIAERALAGGESPWRVHYARMATLFAFGMIHAYLIWSGDILVLYSLCGALVFLVWRLPTASLLAIALILLGGKLAIGITDFVGLKRFETHAIAADATTVDRIQWRDWLARAQPDPADAPREVAAFRGSYAQAFAARRANSWFLQTVVMRAIVPDTLALMLIGMALMRSGFFSGAWSKRHYRIIAVGGCALFIPAYIPVALWIDATHFSPVTLVLTDAMHPVLLRPFLSLAYAAAVILFVQSRRLNWLADRLAATGRMAFSNYLGTSLVCTLIFNGYGLGWFGYLERWQLYLLVPVLWAVMLAWSKPWLDRFAYGPFEWLWRSVARGRSQPMRRLN